MTDNIAEAVHQLLQDNSAVTALASSRGYSDALPQGTPLPAYTYEEISCDSEHDLEAAAGIAHTRLQISCYAAKPSQATALREAIRAALLPYRGPTSTDQHITDVTVAGRYSRYEPPLDASRAGRYLRCIDFLVSHTESIPTLP